MMELVVRLQRAYSGERSAALAYVGSARAVRDPRVARRIRAIARDEWVHRRELRAVLRTLGSGPSALQERLRGWLGVVLGRLCVVSERLPAWAAARLEERGAAEYEEAARLADRDGLAAEAATLRRLARVERRHARYFRALAGR